MLAVKNPYERDQFIEFEEKEHIYKVHGEQYPSVTQFVSAQFAPFETNLIIYIIRKYNPEYQGKTKQEILKEWEDARNYGTMLHADIERYYNGLPPKHLSLLGKEYNMFLNYVSDFQSMIPYRTEWRIYSEKIKIAGTIDMIYRKKNGHFLIVDWKRCKQIKKDGYKKYSLTIPNLPDTNFYHYMLQLNMYKYILETCYNLKIDSMYICILHPKQENYELHEIDEMDIESLFFDNINHSHEVDEIMEYFDKLKM